MKPSSFLCRLVLVSFTTSTAAIVSEQKAPLFQQCWHETPFSSVHLQSSRDGISELVIGLSLSSLSSPDHAPKSRSKFHPWSHEPVCTEILESVGSKLCVYTNASFADGRGISIFTTPRIADEVAASPAFRDPAALSNMDINTFSGAWYTEELPGKGVGMLAKKKLSHGTRVTAYTPALIAYLEQDLPTLKREEFYRVAVNQLPPRTKDSYLRLATVYGDPRVRAQDVVKANTFQMHVGGQNHLAVFPETSRLNHACSPKYVGYIAFYFQGKQESLPKGTC
jgi:hypothetical protein